MNVIKDFTNLPIETQIFFISKISHILTNKNYQNDFKFNEIRIENDKTELFFFNKSLNLPVFINCLKKFRKIYFEINYDVQTFNLIYELLKKIQYKNRGNLTINIEKTLDFYEPKIEFGSLYIYEYIVDISIPSSVKSIRPKAFYKCPYLKIVKLPSFLESIGYRASFYKCESLKTVETKNAESSNDSNIIINEILHSMLLNIETPVIGGSIGFESFCGCTSLINFESPSSITSIDDYAFFDCLSLKEIQIPSSVTSIGSHSFYNCILLDDIKIPSSLKFIGFNAFGNCSSLMEIKISPSISFIESESFYDKESLIFN